MTDTVIAAAVQAAPVWLDRAATLDKLVGLTEKAAGAGAGLCASRWAVRAAARAGMVKPAKVTALATSMAS